MSFIRKHLSYTQLIMLGFFGIILFGGILLSLPISSKTHQWTPFIDAMFTATSATCVTGLIAFDTFTHWSGFGQVVIISLIQIGGLGVMTCIALIALVLKRRISLGERRLLMQSAGSLQLSGIVKLVQRIISGTILLEGCGVVLLSIAFIPKMGFFQGLWNAVFHSISAFCNAGFDLMGKYTQFGSLAGSEYAFNPLVNITILSLIVVGGIGFIVWHDISRNGFHFNNYELHSKIVLLTTAVLVIMGPLLYFIFEYNFSLEGLSLGDKVLASFFQGVTPRTAGFNTVDLAKMSDSGVTLTNVLMFIGGSPGSTAGGIKTTTFFVLILGALTSARRFGSITIFKRKIDSGAITQASSIVTLYTACLVIAIMLISAVEPHALRQIVFECISAIGTVGLSLGITPALCPFSHIILMFLMFAGRVGGLSLMLVLSETRIGAPIERPTAKILIG